MNCLITRNQEGRITKVVTPTGEKSVLFDEINSIPYLADAETSLNIFANAYTKEVEDMFQSTTIGKYKTGEPRLYFSNGKQAFISLEELLIDGTPASISIGFRNPKTNKLINIASFETQSSPKASFITEGIQSGLISPKRVLGEDGITRFQGKGFYPQTKQTQAKMASLQAMYDHGEYIKVNEDGTFEIEFKSDLVNVDGEIIPVHEIPNKITPTTKDAAPLIVNYALTGRNNKKAKVNEKEVQNTVKSLFGFLESLGFSVSSLEAYKESYKTRYGQDPDIQAIADLTNKIVAFSNGEIALEDLSEEVAHLAVESFVDRNAVDTALEEVATTPEYAEHAPYYRAKYAPFYTGEKLEEQVRKEVLGKILSKEIQKKMEGSKSIFRQILDYFINLLRNNYKAYHNTAIKSLNERITKAVVSRQYEAFDEAIIPEGFFYSATPQSNQNIEANLKRGRKALEDIYTRVLNERTPSKEELERIGSEYQNQEVLSSINTIVGLSQTQVNILEAEIKEANAQRRPVSERDQKRFHMLSGQVEPVLKNLKYNLTALIPTLEEKDAELARSLSTQIGNILRSLDDIEPAIESQVNEELLKEVDEILQDAPETTKDAVKSQLEATQKDLSLFQKMFMIASKSSNFLVQMLRHYVSQMNTSVYNRMRDTTSKAMQEIDKDGLASEQSTIIKKVNGSKTGFYLSMFNWGEFMQDKAAKQAELIAELTGQDYEEVLKNIKGINFRKVLQDKYTEFSTRMTEWERSSWKENRFSEKYYEDRFKRFDQLNTAQETQETLSNLNSAVFEITKKAQNPDGTIDNSKLTEADKINIQAHRQRKSSLKSAYNNSGELKEGLVRIKVDKLSAAEKSNVAKLLGVKEEVLDREGNQVNLFTGIKGEVTILAPGYNLENLPKESRLALDLSNLELLFRQEMTTTRGVKSSFTSMLDSKQSNPNEAYQWLLSNATISFTDAVFDNMESNEGYDEVAEKYIDTLEAGPGKDAKTAALLNYRKLQQQKKDLLRQFRKAGNPLEVDAFNMGEVRTEIRSIEAKIYDAKRVIELPQEYMKEAGDRITTLELNEDFYFMMQSSGKSLFDFALEHMTERNATEARGFAIALHDALYKSRVNIKGSYSKFIKDRLADGTITSDMTLDEKYQTLKDAFAKNRVAQYFKRYQPAGYTELIDALKQGDINLSDLFDENKVENLKNTYEGLKYIKISPDYSWTEDLNGSQYENKAFMKDTPYFLQPKMKYADPEFFDKFGINMEEWKKNPTMDLNKLTATKNQKAFRLLQIVTNLKDEANKTYGQQATANKFKMVPMSIQGAERLTGLTNKAGWQEMVRDVFQDRKDEKIFGELVDDNLTSGERINVIPKMFQADLEDGPDAITENVLFAELSNLKQSILFDERNKIEPKMKAVLFKIKHQEFLASGGKVLKNRITRTGQDSNMYHMGEEYVKHHLYGVQQTRNFETTILGKTVNLTKVGTMIQAWSQRLNLGYNPFIALTSATTGVLNTAVNRIAGDKYHKSSGRFAIKEATKIVGANIMETGKLNKTSKLSRIYQYFGIESINERAEDSRYGRGLRLLFNSAYGMDELANKPVTAQATIAAMKDTRWYNDKFYSHNEFFNKMSEEKLSPKEIEQLWESMYNDSLYENMDFEEDSTGPNAKFRDKFETEEQFNAYWSRLQPRVTTRIKTLIQEVDSVLNEEDRVQAQRDVMVNFTMQHRGWLLINLQSAFKKKGYNIASGQFEEGYYRTFYELLKATKLNPKKFAQAYSELTPSERRNTKKVGVQISTVALLLLLGEFLMMADDDDDSWMENLTQLIYLRTVNEFNSSTIIGTPGSILDTVENPIPSLTLLKSFEPVSLFNAWGERDNEGNSKFWKQLLGKSLLVNRRYKQLSDLQEQVDAFRFYNTETLFNLGPDNKNK